MTDALIAALRILSQAVELATEQPLPLRIQNRRRAMLDMAVRLARETLAVAEQTP